MTPQDPAGLAHAEPPGRVRHALQEGLHGLRAVPARRYLLWALYPALGGVLMRWTPVGPLLGVVSLLLVGLALALWLGRTDRRLEGLLLAAFGLRILVAFADEAFGFFPKGDAIGFHRHASDFAQHVLAFQPWDTVASPSIQAYAVVVSPLYLLFGAEMMLPRLLNCIVGTASVAVLSSMVRSFFSPQAALASAAAFAFYPSLLQLHTENLRDTMVLFAILVAFWAFMASSWPQAAQFCVAGACLAPLFFLRTTTFFLVFLALAIFVTDRTLFRRRRPHYGRLVSGFRTTARLLLPVLVIIGFAAAGWVLAESGHSPLILPETRGHYATGGSAYLEDLGYGSWESLLPYLPLLAAYFLFSPFPWQVHNSLAGLAFAENVLLFYPVVVLAVFQLFRGARNAAIAVSVLYLLVGAAAFGLVEGNVGTALRHRSQFTWVFFVLAGPPLARLLGQAAAVSPWRRAHVAASPPAGTAPTTVRETP